MNLGKLRIILWAVVGLAAIAGLFVALRGPPAGQAITSSNSMADIGGPFLLTGSDGQPFSSERLAGRPYALFFGFTQCPDVCPTTLARLAKLRKQVGKGDESFAIVLVSVDPERDTPAEMARYAGLFGTPVIALTGSIPAVEGIKALFGVTAQKVPQPDGAYTVDHTATTFLMDANGKFAATISPNEGDDAALAKLKRLTTP